MNKYRVVQDGLMEDLVTEVEADGFETCENNSIVFFVKGEEEEDGNYYCWCNIDTHYFSNVFKVELVEEGINVD